MLEALHRDQQERDALIFRQLGERRALQTRILRLRKLARQRTHILSQDREQYQGIKNKQRDVADFLQRAKDHRSHSRPSLEP